MRKGKSTNSNSIRLAAAQHAATRYTIDYAVKLAGIDHVGLGSDFDGICVGPKGLEDVSKIGAVAAEMSRRGYSKTQVDKVCGQNLMDVWQRVINCSELER